MSSLLNTSRPPVFCPGCSHERIVKPWTAGHWRGWGAGSQVVIVSDIGCSGLFDTFFNTHAFHGLHGRALTYATGLKMARPELTVVVTMGDGGLGIGGAHVLSTCRRNIDLTLLVLNNFNYGMTGGQCSSTTPQEARGRFRFSQPAGKTPGYLPGHRCGRAPAFVSRRFLLRYRRWSMR
jgi:2-oxoglutarate ferredoxin oxidoreductase subunit beta